MPQVFVCLCTFLYRFEFLLRDEAVAVEYACVLLEVFNHRACLRFGVFAVQLSVGGHIFIDIVAAVRHFVIRPFPLELLALLRRGVASDFPRCVGDVKYYRLFCYKLSSSYNLAAGKPMAGFPYREAKMQRGTRNCIFLILLRFFSKSSHFRCLFCLPTLPIFLLVVPC